jgi:hypothetical protein
MFTILERYDVNRKYIVEEMSIAHIFAFLKLDTRVETQEKLPHFLKILKMMN